MKADLAFGITAAVRPDHARLGAEVERLDYRELWVNDTPRGDGLATLSAAASDTQSLRFGVGVIALSEHAPAEIVERVEAANLPTDRLTVGVGSGSSASLQLVRDSVAELRRLVPDLSLAVAAVGPQMAHLAGEIADAVVANWALPDRLAWIRERVAEGACAAGRPNPRLVAYVRTAVGPGAADRLQAEMDRYRGYGAHYARAFDAQPGGGLIGVAVESGDPVEVATALAPYRSVVDTLVIRGLPPDDSVDRWLQIAAVIDYR
ncbi:MAG: LLM class flavin-dependent oxidoreductase [Chloroflexi bacterium]|nr:LLM class flavin-dependent oxidoreductase [Chloroflexota bacterium]